MTPVDIPVSPELAAYIRRVSLREPDVLRRLRAETASHPRISMQISPEQGQFMALLIHMLGARRTLEIGVFTGYSSLAVALALPEHGRMIACDVSEEYTAVARRYWREAGVEGKIDLRLRPAVQTLNDLIALGQAASFDFAFIDADKENYENYYERCLTLIRPGGLIAVDNVLRRGWVAGLAAPDERTVLARAFNDHVVADARTESVIVPIADGLSLITVRG